MFSCIATANTIKVSTGSVTFVVVVDEVVVTVVFVVVGEVVGVVV